MLGIQAYIAGVELFGQVGLELIAFFPLITRVTYPFALTDKATYVKAGIVVDVATVFKVGAKTVVIQPRGKGNTAALFQPGFTDKVDNTAW